MSVGVRRRDRRARHTERGQLQGLDTDHAAAARQPHPLDQRHAGRRGRATRGRRQLTLIKFKRARVLTKKKEDNKQNKHQPQQKKNYYYKTNNNKKRQEKSSSPSPPPWTPRPPPSTHTLTHTHTPTEKKKKIHPTSSSPRSSTVPPISRVLLLLFPLS